MKLPDPKNWTLVSFAALVTPWQEKISTIELISESFRPDIQILSSIFGVLFGTIGLIIWRRISLKRLQKRLIISGAFFGLSIMICFALSQTVGRHIEFGQFGTIALKFVWPVLYVIANVSFSMCISVILLVYFRDRAKHDQKSQT